MAMKLLQIDSLIRKLSEKCRFSQGWYNTRRARQSPPSPSILKKKNEWRKPWDSFEVLLLFLEEVRVICVFLTQVRFLSINSTFLAVIVCMDVGKSIKMRWCTYMCILRYYWINSNMSSSQYISCSIINVNITEKNIFETYTSSIYEIKKKDGERSIWTLEEKTI